jgi:RNA polymerase sigma factor (sigma-70 family)
VLHPTQHNIVNTDEQHTLFDAWVDRHAAVLHHIANGFAEGADRHDLMQELLLAVWRAVPAFRGGAQVSTYLFRVAHNAALTWKRTERSYRQRVSHFESHGVHETHVLPQTDSRARETLELLYRLIRQLPPVDRSLILLKLDGVSYAEIAAIHGITESNVGVRLSRLKQKLSDSMKEVSHELR